MAQDQNNPEDAGVGMEESAKSMTSALALTASLLTLVAFLVMQAALGKWFHVGLFGK